MYSGKKYLFQLPDNRSAISLRPPKVVTGQGPARSVDCEAITKNCQVGFPIRTSRDQRVLSPPPGLSQSATSFIASCRQGIHQTPFSRLIRSGRRQALLRAARAATRLAWPSGRTSFDQRPPVLGREAPSEAGTDPRTDPDRPHGQCLDLERLQNPMYRPRRRTDGRTGSPRATPWSGRGAKPFLAEPAALSGKTPKTIHEDLRLVFLLS